MFGTVHWKVTELWLILVAVSSVFVGYFIGSYKTQIALIKFDSASCAHVSISSQWFNKLNITRINATTNPRGAESLAPGIVEPYSDFYLHDMQENSSEDLVRKPKYLLALAVGYNQKDMVNEIIVKFSENFTLVLFHYDGRTSEWDQFEWSHRAIHISARKQTKWWYAKRFLHPDIVSKYEYIFIWDEDIGVEHFNAEEYLKLAKKHGLEISQPGIESKRELVWSITKRRDDVEVHKKAHQDPNCTHQWPPCTSFIEIMVPVFSRKSWQCFWHVIQNDLVHGWGLDFELRRCVERPQETMGVVDAQWVEHKNVPSLGDQGSSSDGRPPRESIEKRGYAEWSEFKRRTGEG